MGAIAQALTDKDFLNASPDDQKAYLAHIDKDFSTASPQDQQAYLNHILAPSRLAKSTQPTQFEQNINSQRGITSPYDPNAKGVAQRFLGAAGASFLGTPAALAHTVMHPIDTASGIADSIESYFDPARRPTWEGIKSVLPEALGGGVGNVSAGEVIKGIPKAYQNVREAAYTPEGTPKPIVKSIGSALQHPTEIPGKMIGGAAKVLFPPPEPAPVYPGAPLPLAEDFYANRGAEMSRMMRQQPDAFAPPEPPEPELGSPENPGFMSKLPSRLPPNLRGDPFSPKPTPPAEYPGAPLPLAEDFYEHRGADIAGAMRQQPEAFGISRDSAKSRIITPETQASLSSAESEGSPARWTNERVRQLAAQGNRDAITQAVRRGFELPPNARYVAGDAAYSPAAYNPRNVTVFAPDGTPITQAEGPGTNLRGNASPFGDWFKPRKVNR